VNIKKARPPEERRDPIADMAYILRRAGRETFDGKGEWENCMCALVSVLDPRVRTYRLLEALPYRKSYLDQADILNALSNLGYYARRAETTLDSLDPRLLPCLFVAGEGGPAVIFEEDDAALRYYKKGATKRIRREEAGGVRGTAWFFERYDENRAATSKFRRLGSGMGWFRALTGRFYGTLGQIFLAGLALNIIALTTPLYTMLVYDRVIASGTVSTLPMLVLGVAISIWFEWMLRGIRSRGLSWLAARMDNVVSNRIFSHLIGLPATLIERASVAAQIARIKTFESVRDFFSGSVFLSMLEMPFVVIAALAIYAIAGPLVFVPVSMIAVYGLLFYVIHRRVRSSIRLAAKASSTKQQFTIETFEKIKGLRCYGLTEIWREKYRDLSGKEMLSQFHLSWLGMVGETCANAVTLFAAVATVGFGAHLIWQGQMTTGALVASMILVWRILTPFYSLCTMIPRLEQIRNSILQVDKLMDIETEEMEARTAARLPKMRGRVTFNHAGLRYSDEGDFVFENLSFDAKLGEIAVITGENGAGKSSLLKLIKGLYTAQNGSVQIDGFDIRQLDAPDLRRQIAYVPQNPDFFQGTILENLRIGNPLAGEEDIQRALQTADVWEDILTLPAGLNTIVGRYGHTALPSGFTARLSLARAYLHSAPILLIDELPNALLSGRTGKNLKDYLARMKGRRTAIVVSYREDFMNLADKLILLRRGEMPITGPRDDIMNLRPETFTTKEAA
jgi:ABC-type bacteriocin/lantibiotic exporter with double-glycine peptidase domain